VDNLSIVYLWYKKYYIVSDQFDLIVAFKLLKKTGNDLPRSSEFVCNLLVGHVQLVGPEHLYFGFQQIPQPHIHLLKGDGIDHGKEFFEAFVVQVEHELGPLWVLPDEFIYLLDG